MTKHATAVTAASEDFAADEDAPIDYMRHTRTWYLRLGYHKPYRWPITAMPLFSD